MTNKNYQSLYKLPLRVTSSMGWFLRIVAILSIISAGFFAYMSMYFYITDDTGISGIAMALFFSLFGGIFAYMFVFYDILRKGYIEVTVEYLEFRDLYKLRRFQCGEIHSIGAYSLKGNTTLGLILKKHLERQKSLWRKMNSALGDPYDVRLALSVYSSIDEDTLLMTIIHQHNSKVRDAE